MEQSGDIAIHRTTPEALLRRTEGGVQSLIQSKNIAVHAITLVNGSCRTPAVHLFVHHNNQNKGISQKLLIINVFL